MMKRNLLLLLLVVSASMQAVRPTSPNLKVQEELDRCKRGAPSTSGIIYLYDSECVNRVKKKYPGQVQQESDREVTSTVHAGM